MTYCPNWGFNSDEGPLVGNSSFNGQDGPSHVYRLAIVPNERVWRYIDNAHCYLLVITSDYTLHSVSSIINFLWEKKEMLSYSFAVATQGDLHRCREVIAFSRHPRALKDIPKILCDVLGLDVHVVKLNEFSKVISSSQPQRALHQIAGDVMKGMDHVIGILDHAKHTLLQHILTSMILNPKWFTFSWDGDSLNGPGGVVARISPEFHQFSGEEECAGGNGGHLDVCKVTSLNIDQTTGMALLTVTVKAYNYYPLNGGDFVEGAEFSCLCSGELFTSVDSDVKSHGREEGRLNHTDHLFQASSPFLSSFDEANCRRCFSSYLPTTLQSYINYFWYQFGFNISDCAHRVHTTVNLVVENEDEGDDDDFFMDVNLISKSDVVKMQRECHISSVKVVSTSGPRVYPLVLMSLR